MRYHFIRRAGAAILLLAVLLVGCDSDSTTIIVTREVEPAVAGLWRITGTLLSRSSHCSDRLMAETMPLAGIIDIIQAEELIEIRAFDSTGTLRLSVDGLLETDGAFLAATTGTIDLGSGCFVRHDIDLVGALAGDIGHWADSEYFSFGAGCGALPISCFAALDFVAERCPPADCSF